MSGASYGGAEQRFDAPLDRLLDDITATVTILAAGRMALRRFVAEPEFEDDRQALATATGDVRRGLVAVHCDALPGSRDLVVHSRAGPADARLPPTQL